MGRNRWLLIGTAAEGDYVPCRNDLIQPENMRDKSENPIVDSDSAAENEFVHIVQILLFQIANRFH